MKAPRPVLLAAFLAASCGRKEAPPGGAAPSASAPVAASATAPQAEPPGTDSPHGPAGGTLRPPTEACRALSVSGKMRSESGRPLERGQVVDGADWLEAEAGAKLALRHAVTTRELAFEGKGRLRACARGDEELLFTRGKVTTTAGAGARPGAEVLLATPFGVVRYGDAKLQLVVDGGSVTLKVASGAATLEGPGPGDLPERVGAGGAARRVAGAVDVKALVDRCEQSARASEARAREVLAPAPSAAPLGNRAAEHVRARQKARAGCAVASAALGTMPPGPERTSFEDAVSRAESVWRGVPSRLVQSGKVESR